MGRAVVDLVVPEDDGAFAGPRADDQAVEVPAAVAPQGQQPAQPLLLAAQRVAGERPLDAEQLAIVVAGRLDPVATTPEGEELIRNPGYPLRDDEPLVTGGLIDSFAIAQIGVFVEKAFGVYVPDTELTVENMDDLGRMTACVLRTASESDRGGERG